MSGACRFAVQVVQRPRVPPVGQKPCGDSENYIGKPVRADVDARIRYAGVQQGRQRCQGRLLK